MLLVFYLYFAAPSAVVWTLIKVMSEGLLMVLRQTLMKDVFTVETRMHPSVPQDEEMNSAIPAA